MKQAPGGFGLAVTLATLLALQSCAEEGSEAPLSLLSEGVPAAPSGPTRGSPPPETTPEASRDAPPSLAGPPAALPQDGSFEGSPPIVAQPLAPPDPATQIAPSPAFPTDLPTLPADPLDLPTEAAPLPESAPPAPWEAPRLDGVPPAPVLAPLEESGRSQLGQRAPPPVRLPEAVPEADATQQGEMRVDPETIKQFAVYVLAGAILLTGCWLIRLILWEEFRTAREGQSGAGGPSRLVDTLAAYGFQIVGLSFILPVVLVASVSADLKSEALTAILGAIVGYIFGSAVHAPAAKDAEKPATRPDETNTDQPT